MDDDVTFLFNIPLPGTATGGVTSTVCEPSVANTGDQLLVTGNWFAARSVDGGANFQHLDPSVYFPHVDGGFCCDQTVIQDPGRDILVWLLQYVEADGTNSLRVAVKRHMTLGSDAWHWWDLKPALVNPAWADEWFDYNHAALSNNFLYIGTNVFGTNGGPFTRAVVFRLSLDELAEGGPLSLQRFDTTANGSLRCTQGATDTMYFASHNNLAQIRLFAWPENAATVSTFDIDVGQWNGGFYQAPADAGGDFLSRADGRITGGWVGGGRIGFMWTANANGGAGRPLPHVRVVRIDETTKTRIDEPDIWSGSIAFAYPDAAVDADGTVGVALFYGGGPRNASFAVGIRDDADTRWKLKSVASGTHMPTSGTYGDYCTARSETTDRKSFLAAGFTLQGGGARQDVEPRIVRFGRAGTVATI